MHLRGEVQQEEQFTFMDSKGEIEKPSSALAALEDDDIERNLHDGFYKYTGYNTKNSPTKKRTQRLGFSGRSDSV